MSVNTLSAKAVVERCKGSEGSYVILHRMVVYSRGVVQGREVVYTAGKTIGSAG